MSVTAIVVNFNAGDALRQCVQALLNGSLVPGVVVADNASTDGSASELRSLYGKFPGLEILFNPTNLGFAAAVNACAKSVSVSACSVPANTSNARKVYNSPPIDTANPSPNQSMNRNCPSC